MRAPETLTQAADIIVRTPCRPSRLFAAREEEEEEEDGGEGEKRRENSDGDSDVRRRLDVKKGRLNNVYCSLILRNSCFKGTRFKQAHHSYLI